MEKYLYRKTDLRRTLMKILLLIIGFGLLIKGADYFVEGASALAKKLGVSSLIIGLTVVAMGTSFPELVVNVYSAIEGKSDIGFGNIIGSNILNLFLILGLAGMISPLDVKKSTVWKDLPFSLLAAFVLFVLLGDVAIDAAKEGFLSRSDGIILLVFFGVFLAYILDSALRKRTELINQEKNEKTIKGHLIFLMVTGGLASLVIGGKWVVDGAVFVAKLLGVSDFIISATIVAAGTSLPELVTSVVAAVKKEMDISVGNVVGSNICNIFLILGAVSYTHLTLPTIYSV